MTGPKHGPASAGPWTVHGRPPGAIVAAVNAGATRPWNRHRDPSHLDRRPVRRERYGKSLSTPGGDRAVAGIGVVMALFGLARAAGLPHACRATNRVSWPYRGASSAEGKPYTFRALRDEPSGA